MHSSPIDLLNSSPKPQKAAPAESEPDGRFSELLRGSSEAEAKPAEAAEAPMSKPAAPADDASRTEAGSEAPVKVDQQVAVEPAAETATRETPAAELPLAETMNIAPPVAAPEAITWTQPQAGVVVSGVPAGVPEAPSDAPLAQPPKPAPATGAPFAIPTASNSTGMPAPTGAANGMPPAPQGQSPAGPAVPADVAAPTRTAEVANSATIIVPPAKSSLIATTQPVVATAAPVAVAGKAITGNDIPAEAAQKSRPSAATPAATIPSDTVLSDRATATPAPATERLATAQAATSTNGEPAVPKDVSDLPATAAPKAVPDLGQAAATTSAPKPVATLAAPFLVTDKSSTVNATATPATVAETADMAPPTSQADPVAATNSSPVGRMTTTATASTTLAHTPATAQPAAEQVVLQVQRAVREGVDRLTMQLKPASLGRVDIQMEVGFDGRLQAVISAERPETLQLLQRDARTLTEALNDAGLQTDSGSLSFNLRGQAGDHGGGNNHEPSDIPAAGRTNPADDMNAATTEITLTLGDGRVDIKV